jgi:hypothetical protein
MASVTRLLALVRALCAVLDRERPRGWRRCRTPSTARSWRGRTVGEGACAVYTASRRRRRSTAKPERTTRESRGVSCGISLVMAAGNPRRAGRSPPRGAPALQSLRLLRVLDRHRQR